MDQSLKTKKYAEILTQTLREKSNLQFRIIPDLRVVSSCDAETGQFLLLMIGWDNRGQWVHSILFHAEIVNGKVVIESDMTEEGLYPSLLEAGIPAEDFLSDVDRQWMQKAQAAAA